MAYQTLEGPDGAPVTAKANGSGALKVDVTAMSGGGDASAANQTNGAQKAQVTDGTNSAAVLNTAPTTEYGVVTRNIPSGTQAVSGTFFQATQPVSAVTLPLPTDASTETTLSAIATNTPAPLGTSFARIRGTVSTTSTAFPSQSFPRGFWIRNLESVKTIYVAAGTVTVGDGWPILPGEIHEFDLPNSDLLQGITSAATSAYAIGGVT